MTRLFLAPAIGALALATASPAFAQYGRPDMNRGSYGRSSYYGVERIAYDNGYAEGIEEGQKDGRSRDRFYFQDEGDFKRADKGYSRSFGDKELYRRTFRAGFADGYREGYESYTRGGSYGGNYGQGNYGRNDGNYGRGRGWTGGDRYLSPFDIGVRDGYEKGRDAARSRRTADPRREGWYRQGDRDYDNRYGSREQFKDEYRRGFLSGYDRGFREGRY